MPQPVVAIIEDEQFAAQPLKFLLETVDIRARWYSDAVHFLEVYNPEMMGCVVSDVIMPGMTGLELQDELIARQSCLPLILVTGHSNVGMAVNAIKKGAFHFMEKPYEHEEMLHQIQSAFQWNRERMAEAAIIHKIQERQAVLTPREQQVMALMIKGQPTRKIANRLNISPRTAEVHRSRVLEKMEVNSLVELVRMMTGVPVRA